MDHCRCGPGVRWCARADALFDVAGMHVLDVIREPERLVLTVETDRDVAGCPTCGVVAIGHGRRRHRVHDAPCFSVPVVVVWAKRVWRCVEPTCATQAFSETHRLVGPRAKLTARAVEWAVAALGHDDTTVSALARHLGVDWHTLWAAVEVEATRRVDHPGRLDGVAALGVDEHIWKPSRRGHDRAVTSMVDLTRDAQRLPARTASGRRPGPVRDRVRGLAEEPADTVRRRGGAGGAGPLPWLRQRDPRRAARRGRCAGRLPRRPARHPGRRRGPPPRPTAHRRAPRPQGRSALQIRGLLRHGAEHLGPRQVARLDAGLIAGDPGWEVTIAWQCYQQLRSIYHAASSAEGRRTAERVIASFPTCPIAEVARLGRTLRAWRTQLLAYFDTGGVNNGGTEAINLLIEKTRRLAHGFRNFTHYRLRILLAASGTRAYRRAPPAHA